MIIFIGEGGLGNQIYQYAFIKNFLRQKELLVVFNFGKFKQLFDYEDKIINVENKYVYYVFRVFMRTLLSFLSKLRVISSVRTERYLRKGIAVEGKSYIHIKGLLPITYIYPGYFQSEAFYENANLEGLKIKDIHVRKAKEVLNDIPRQYKRCFVHVRRGDYKYESALGVKDIRLPISYYRKALKELNKKYNRIYYIFMSNDISFVENEFVDIKNKVLSNESDLTDFTIMTLCDGGVISNSSFSLWGSYFGCKECIVAPKYWFGFKSKVEIPVGVSPSFAKIVEFR